MGNNDQFTQIAIDLATKMAAKEQNLDPDLIRAMIKVESNDNPNAISHKGASGLMQLMPGTAKEMGVTDTSDLYQNIRGGTKYMAQQMKKYNNNKDLAWAAYNAGPGAVKKYNGVPPFKETQGYIKKNKSVYAGFKKDAIFKQIEKDLARKMMDEAAAKVPKKVAEGHQKYQGSVAATVGQLPRGIALGVGNLLDLPIDAVNWGAKALGIDSSFFQEGMWADLLTVDELTPKNTTERIISRTGEAVGEGIASWLLTLGVGGMAKQVLVGGSGVVTPLVAKSVTKKLLMSAHELNKVLIANPKSVMALDALIDAGGGVTAGMLEEMFPDNKLLAGMAGEFIGAFGLQAFGRVVKGSVKFAGDLFPHQANIEAVTGHTLRQSQSPEDVYQGQRQAASEAGRYLEEDIPPGMMSEDMEGLQRGAQLASKEFDASIKGKQASLNESLRRKISEQGDSFTPTETGLPDVRSRLQEEFDIEAGRAAQVEADTHAFNESEIFKLQADNDALVDSVNMYMENVPQGKKTQAARVIRQKLDDKVVEMQGKYEELYKQFKGDGKWALEDVLNLRKVLEEKITVTEMAQIEKINPSFFAILDKYKKKELDIGILDLTKLKTAVWNDAVNIKDPSLSRVMKGFTKDIDRLIDTPPDSFPESKVQLLREVQQQYKTDHDIFKSDYSGEIIARTAPDKYKITDEEVISKYIIEEGVKGSEAAFNQMKRAIGTDSEVEGALMNHILSDVMSVVDDSAIGGKNRTRAMRWLHKYKHVMDDFPNIKAELENMTGLIDNAKRSISETEHGIVVLRDSDKAAAELYASTMRDINKKYEPITYKGEGYSDAQFIPAILSKKNALSEIKKLKKTMGNDKIAQAGLKKAFWEYMFGNPDVGTRGKGMLPSARDKAGFPLYSSNNTKKFLEDSKMLPIIKELYDEKHLKNIGLISESARVIARSDKTSNFKGSDTVPNIIELLRTVLMRRVRAVPMKHSYIFAEKVMKKLSIDTQAKAQALLEKSLFDEDFARELIELSYMKEPPKLGYTKIKSRTPEHKEFSAGYFDKIKRLNASLYLYNQESWADDIEKRFEDYTGPEMYEPESSFYNQDIDMGQVMMEQDNYQEFLDKGDYYEPQMLQQGGRF